MGTPSTALQHRTDNKLYRLQTGQSPIVRPALHNTYAMDSYPNGTNAIVAVISYTGYDMEDAMILNKSSHERGFAYGTVYKSQIVDLKDMRGSSKSTTAPSLHFGCGKDIARSGDKEHSCFQILDPDGLPRVGSRLQSGDPIAAYVDDTTGKTKFVKYKGDEMAYVNEVRLLGSLLIFPSCCSGLLIFLRKRRRRHGAAKNPHHSTHHPFSCYRRQVLLSTRTKGCLLAEVARGGHTVLREWDATRRHH